MAFYRIFLIVFLVLIKLFTGGCSDYEKTYEINKKQKINEINKNNNSLSSIETKDYTLALEAMNEIPHWRKFYPRAYGLPLSTKIVYYQFLLCSKSKSKVDMDDDNENPLNYENDHDSEAANLATKNQNHCINPFYLKNNKPLVITNLQINDLLHPVTNVALAFTYLIKLTLRFVSGVYDYREYLTLAASSLLGLYAFKKPINFSYLMHLKEIVLQKSQKYLLVPSLAKKSNLLVPKVLIFLLMASFFYTVSDSYLKKNNGNNYLDNDYYDNEVDTDIDKQVSFERPFYAFLNNGNHKVFNYLVFSPHKNQMFSLTNNYKTDKSMHELLSALAQLLHDLRYDLKIDIGSYCIKKTESISLNCYNL